MNPQCVCRTTLSLILSLNLSQQQGQINGIVGRLKTIYVSKWLSQRIHLKIQKRYLLSLDTAMKHPSKTGYSPKHNNLILIRFK